MRERPLYDRVIELCVEKNEDAGTCFWLYDVTNADQPVLLNFTVQGPFDTALELAQWAWRSIARELPPARL